MIAREFFTTQDGKSLFKTYSTAGFKIQKNGTLEIYDEAVDLESTSFEYIETTELVTDYEDKLKEGTIIPDGDTELTQEEIAEMLKEVF